MHKSFPVSVNTYIASTFNTCTLDHNSSKGNAAHLSPSYQKRTQSAPSQ